MRFILSTGSLYNDSVDRVFALAAEAGFDGIELMVDERWDTRQADFLKQVATNHALPIHALHSPFNRNCRGWGESEFGAIARTAELAAELGAQVVIHHLPMRVSLAFLQTGKRTIRLPNPFDSSNRQYVDWLNESYQVLQASTGVLLCIENMPAVRALGMRANAPFWNPRNRATLDQITRFPNITLDTTHLATWGLDPLEAYNRWGERVKHIHLSNFDGSEHRRPENGSLRLDALLARLAADRYRFSVSLEMQPDALDAGAPDERVVALLRGSLEFCRRAAAEAEGAAA